MRVISGKNRGLKLLSPRDLRTRPTEDRVKENVFNLLGQNFFDANVLDLFSGSGSIGIEFLSRGAKFCYFIDNDKDAIDTINKNIKKAHCKNNYKVILSGALKVMDRLCGEKFDYIYIDPPYDNSELYLKSIEGILEKNLLEKDGIIIIEEDSSKKLDFTKYLNLIKEKKYGSTSVSIWSLK